MLYEQIKQKLTTLHSNIERVINDRDIEIWRTIKTDKVEIFFIVFKMSKSLDQWGWFCPTENQINFFDGILKPYYKYIDGKNKEVKLK